MHAVALPTTVADIVDEYAAKVTMLPVASFADSGTNVPTGFIVIQN